MEKLLWFLWQQFKESLKKQPVGYNWNHFGFLQFCRTLHFRFYFSFFGFSSCLLPCLLPWGGNFALSSRPSETEVKRWAESLEALLANQYGVAVFHHFLRSEFSEENLDFWLAVEKFKKTHPFSKMAAQAKKIYDEFISSSAVRQVNVDSFVRDSTNQSVRCDLNPTSFQLAQDQIFSLMETDSYPRFLKSRIYAQLANLSTDTVLGLSNNSRSVI
uniref:RGS domain-containing protein n=1 Tax=Cyprinodon variegatus TaxID=28743 RepID=A0A3Q2FR09_CYPVA